MAYQQQPGYPGGHQQPYPSYPPQQQAPPPPHGQAPYPRHPAPPPPPQQHAPYPGQYGQPQPHQPAPPPPTSQYGQYPAPPPHGAPYGQPPPQQPPQQPYGAPPPHAQPPYGQQHPPYSGAPPPHPQPSYGQQHQAPPPPASQHQPYPQQPYGQQPPPHHQPSYHAPPPPQQQQQPYGHPHQHAAPPPPTSTQAPVPRGPAPPPPAASQPQRTQSTASTSSFDDDEDDLAFSMSALTIEEPVTHGTCRPCSSFDPEADAAALRKAMKGLGCDKGTVTNVLAFRSTRQRQEIKRKFKTMYGKDLEKMLHSELGGDFRAVVMALLRDTPVRDAYWLRKAMEGLGTDERCLIEVLVTRDGDEIKEARKAYEEEYQRNLEKDIISETSGHFKRLLISLLQANRPPHNTPVDEAMAREDARKLYSAGEARWGTDESTFNSILCARSFPQLRLTFKEYSKICKYDIIKSIKREMSGDLRNGMVAIAKCVLSKQEYFAERIYRSMKGMGTDEKTLTRCIVSRCEVDMVEIKEAFTRKYGKTMESWIKGDTGGNYRKILLALVGAA